MEVELRAVEDADLPVFFEWQRDPASAALAGLPARDRAAFEAHWARIRRDPEVTIRTVVADGEVAGNVLAFVQSGKPVVGYWIGREHWGRGVGTRALAAFLREVTARPLYATVAPGNAASVRVLEKCGFTLGRRGRGGRGAGARARARAGSGGAPVTALGGHGLLRSR